MKLIYDISSDLQILLRYFNGAAVFAFSGIPLLLLFGADWASVSPNYLVLHTKGLKATLFAILALTVVDSSLQ